jgi:hypothetical protein
MVGTSPTVWSERRAASQWSRNSAMRSTTIT